MLPVGGFAAGAGLLRVAAAAQPAARAAQESSPAAVAAAKEILTIKNASAMYANAVPGLVEQTKIALIQQNLNYQKDLNEVAQIVAQSSRAARSEIGDGMAQVYANEFTEQELKDIVTFYKSPLGKKLLDAEPRAIQLEHGLHEPVGRRTSPRRSTRKFRAEMRKRGKRRSDPDATGFWRSSGHG